MSQIKKVIIPVGGFGTRFLPATKAQPKEMLPIVDKPVIQYLVEEAVASGIQEIIFVTGKGKRAIEDHFDYAGELESFLESRGKTELAKEIRKLSSLAHFAFVRQREPKGAGDALLQAKHLIGQEPVAVLYGDDIVDGGPACLKQLLEVYEKYKSPVLALERVPKKEVYKYGVIRGKKIAEKTYDVLDIIEKPSVQDAPSNLISIGKYIITPEIFDYLLHVKPQPNQELYLTDAFSAHLKKGGKIYGYEFEGVRYDCGDKLGFLKAVVHFGLKHPDVGTAFKSHLRRIKL
ncbi:MAG: UTP--glucose-1-phosphate uridylyltransferase GalU [Candidatus Sungbacteria bacterium]|nr:UTP--glucose-1-phosphate uridylyltransferase GalU [Candidatus Sungbacteria bacterium]